MFPRLVRAAFVGCGVLMAAVAFAQDKPEKLPPPVEEKKPPVEAPPADVPAGVPEGDCCAPPTVHQDFPVHKIHVVEDQELIELPRLPVREEVTAVPFIGLDVEYKEEKRSITFLVAKPRKEERVVNSVSLVPETTCDPCTGHPCTTMKEVPQCHTVTVEVMDVVPETREYTVLVPVLKPANKLALVKRVVMDQTTVPAVRTTFRAVEANNGVTVPMRACLPQVTVPECPHACPAGGCGH